MTAINSQYTFLEVDFHNSYLTQVVKNVPVDIHMKSETNTELKLIPFNLYMDLNVLIRWLLMIPVDIYCAAAWMIAKY